MRCFQTGLALYAYPMRDGDDKVCSMRHISSSERRHIPLVIPTSTACVGWYQVDANAFNDVIAAEPVVSCLRNSCAEDTEALQTANAQSGSPNARSEHFWYGSNDKFDRSHLIHHHYDIKCHNPCVTQGHAGGNTDGTCPSAVAIRSWSYPFSYLQAILRRISPQLVRPRGYWFLYCIHLYRVVS